MADKKISQLTSATALDGSELVELVQAATSKKATVADLRGLSGDNNVAVGVDALVSNEGSKNVAIGSTALTANTTGSFNVAIGAALAQNTTGENNVAICDIALSSNTTGSNNVAIGDGALQSNVDQGNSTAVGTLAAWQTTGQKNTALGSNALKENTTGEFNVAVGFFSGCSSAHPDLNNTISIGYLAEPKASNTSQVGGPDVLCGRTGSPHSLSSLPSPSVVGGGATAFISDCAVTAAGNFGEVATAGGGNTVPVYSDGTDWRIG